MAYIVQGLSQSRSVTHWSSPKVTLLANPNNFLSSSSQALLPPNEHKDFGGFPEMSMPLKNVSIYWIFASSIAIWFLFIHSPAFIMRRKVYNDWPLATHMIGAYTIYLACVVNTLFTPSTLGGKARPWHVWIGRIAMISGLVSFGLGFFCAWWPYRETRPPMGFSLGITFGGIAQVITQRSGYNAIRRFNALKAKLKDMEKAKIQGDELEECKRQKESALRTHIYNMIGLFVAACGIPAGMRIADMLPEGFGVTRLIGVIVLFQLMAKPFGDTYIKSDKKNA
jgi:hypothetical protein